MTDTSITIIEPGIAGWRSADISVDDDLPSGLRFHDDASLRPMDGVFAARITQVDTANDLAFADLGGGVTGCMNLRRAKLLIKGKAQTIADCVTEGQRLLVQVVSEPSRLENKALTITPRPRLAGRYTVLEAGGARLNFSKDIGPAQVKKLTPLLQPYAENTSLIVRSRAATIAPEFVAAEAAMLAKVLETKTDKAGLVFANTPLEKALIGAPDDSTDIMVEGGSAFAEASALAAKRWPDVYTRLSQYKGEMSAFEHYGVQEAIEEALSDQIMLPSGGWISITPTPAMTVIDVNMGDAFKGRSASDAKVIVNMEAALAALYHMRFQDIGGLIVIDFIDMTAKGATRELMGLIEKAAREDRVPVQHTGLSTFGMMEFARKRSGLSLRDRMHVAGRPRMRAEAAALDLLQKGLRIGQAPETGALVLSGPKPVLAWLKAHTHYTDTLQKATQRTVTLMLGTTPDVFLHG